MSTKKCCATIDEIQLKIVERENRFNDAVVEVGLTAAADDEPVKATRRFNLAFANDVEKLGEQLASMGAGNLSSDNLFQCLRDAMGKRVETRLYPQDDGSFRFHVIEPIAEEVAVSRASHETPKAAPDNRETAEDAFEGRKTPQDDEPDEFEHIEQLHRFDFEEGGY